jgi:hypothetical protein
MQRGWVGVWSRYDPLPVLPCSKGDASHQMTLQTKSGPWIDPHAGDLLHLIEYAAPHLILGF